MHTKGWLQRDSLSRKNSTFFTLECLSQGRKRPSVVQQSNHSYLTLQISPSALKPWCKGRKKQLTSSWTSSSIFSVKNKTQFFNLVLYIRLMGATFFKMRCSIALHSCLMITYRHWMKLISLTRKWSTCWICCITHLFSNKMIYLKSFY